MDSKTKKTILISSIVFFIILIVFMFSMLYTVGSSKDLNFSSGKYYCKMNVLHEGNERVFKWDVSISKNNTKNSVVENALNSESLENFRNTIFEISKEKMILFLLILYLIFILIVFLSVQKDTHIYKNENNKNKRPATYIQS